MSTTGNSPILLGQQTMVNSAPVTMASDQTSVPINITLKNGLSCIYVASHIISNTTTTIVASTAYLSTLVISCSNIGTLWTIVIQNKEGTPKILIPNFILTIPTTGLPIILQFAEPILMTDGIDIITTGSLAGVVDVFATYWQ